MSGLIFFLTLIIASASSSDLSQDCTMRLGQFGQGFDIQCQGGQDQIDHFTKHLREQVLLPTVIKMALRTDLCGISDQIEKYGKVFGYRRKNKRHATLNEDQNQWLNHLSDQQLESLLEELDANLKSANVSNSTSFQTQSQSQEVHAEIHTHKHIYVYYSDSGELVALPPFADSLDNSSLAQILDLIQAKPTGSTPISTSVIDPQEGSSSVHGNGVYTCGESSNGYTTNFVNPSYPSYSELPEENGEVCTFMLVITDSSVCQVRVDFVDTELSDPINGECSQQYLGKESF